MKLTKILFEIDSEKELDQEIENYFKNQKELEEKRKAIQEQVDAIKKIEKSLTSRFTKIEKYMDVNKIQEKKVKKWIAKLKTVAKFDRIQPNYKSLWAEALKKVNEATRRVMGELEKAQVDTKKAATKIKLELVEEGIVDIFKSLWNKFKGLFKAFDSYKKISNDLPNLDTIKEMTSTGDIDGHNSKYFIKKTKTKNK